MTCKLHLNLGRDSQIENGLDQFVALVPALLQDEIQREEATANVKFLFVDCGPLKQMLTAHCQLWRSKLTNLLNNLAATELRALHDHFRCAIKWSVGLQAAVGVCRAPVWLPRIV